jgi:hypothetical protein
MKIRIKYTAKGHADSVSNDIATVSGYATFDYDEQKWKDLFESERIDICNEHLEKVIQWSYDDDINEE